MKKTARFASSTIAAGLFAGAALLMPAAAHAAPVVAEDTAGGSAASSVCVVTGGDMSWGVIERFRSYISGSIAHGSWEVADRTNYATPLFSWTNPTGEIDGETGRGIVSFSGSIHFTGHEGVLDMTLSNPAIELKGDGTARMLLDVRSNDPEGNLKIDETQVSFAKIDKVGAFDPQAGEFAFTDASGVLTAEGAPAFGDFYSSGQEIDPVTFSVQYEQCAGSGGTGGTDEGAGAQEPEVTTEAEAVETTEASAPWLPIALGGVAVVIIAVTAGMLIAGRKKTAPAASAASSTQTDAVKGESDA